MYPATAEVLCRVPIAGEATVNEAVEVAHEAFKEWNAMSGGERGRILGKAAGYLYEAHPELARLEVSSYIALHRFPCRRCRVLCVGEHAILCSPSIVPEILVAESEPCFSPGRPCSAGVGSRHGQASIRI